jgi:hypothetical protein
VSPLDATGRISEMSRLLSGDLAIGVRLDRFNELTGAFIGE